MIALTRQSLNSIKSHYLHHFSAILVIHLVFPKLLILFLLGPPTSSKAWRKRAKVKSGTKCDHRLHHRSNWSNLQSQ